jgi:hypothetical protein
MSSGERAPGRHNALPAEPRVSGKPPRYAFFLDPYDNVQSTRCRQRGIRTVTRKLPLVVHVEPRHLLVLNMTCRYCPRGLIPYLPETSVEW